MTKRLISKQLTIMSGVYGLARLKAFKALYYSNCRRPLEQFCLVIFLLMTALNALCQQSVVSQ